MDFNKTKIIINNYIYNLSHNTSKMTNLDVLFASIIFYPFTYSLSYLIFTESDSILVKLIIIFISILISIIPILILYLNKKYKNKELIFNKSIYNVPKTGDKMICIKPFYYDNSANKMFKKFSRAITMHILDYSKVYKGETLTLTISIETHNDWWLGFKNKNDEIMYLFYLSESKKILKTKSEIRRDRLKKIKI